jgi:hypothetical protein
VKLLLHYPSSYFVLDFVSDSRGAQQGEKVNLKKICNLHIRQNASCVQLVHVLVLVLNTGTVLFGSGTTSTGSNKYTHRIQALASWACIQNRAAQEAST